MGRPAFVLTLELGVALPYSPAVLAGGVPHLGAIGLPAVAAHQLAREGAAAHRAPVAVPPPGELQLHLLPLLRQDDGRVAVLHIVLGDLPLVHLHLFLQEIHSEPLLEQGGALVLLVAEDALHRLPPPGILSGRGRDGPPRQPLGDGVGGKATHEHPVDVPDDLRLLRDYLWKPIRSFFVPKEMAVWQADLSIREPLSLAPGDVLGYGATLLLGQTGHDGEQQLALAVEGVDVLLLEEALAAGVLELADDGEAVHGVAGEAADGFGDDEVYLSIQGIRHHAVEAVPVLGVQAGDTLVRIDAHELPVGVGLDVLGVVVHLGLIAGILLIAVRGHTGVPGHTALGGRGKH